MILPYKLRALTLLIVVAICALAGPIEALAQRLPTAREPENKPVSPRRPVFHKRQPTPVAASKNPAAIESDNFFKLGDRFREQQKWRAAEAAYKEAVTVAPGNIDALVALGYLYLDRNRIDEAQQTYGKLR